MIQPLPVCGKVIMKLTHLIQMLTVSMLIFQGCDTSDKNIDVTQRGKNITIAVIPKGTIHEFWKSVHAGAIKASRETGVEIIWKGSLREDDQNQPISQQLHCPTQCFSIQPSFTNRESTETTHETA